ncbi:MAG: glutathione peroxidase [Verrucomicrobiae bacterium]|nr:glutathione peroxidase [Verrucomicrobiae bacterium]
MRKLLLVIASAAAWILAMDLDAADAAKSVFEIPVRDAHAKPTDLSAYKGKVLLIVNVASKCGFTPQYSGLESLYEKYKDKGFDLLAFPSNDFGGQEPGTLPEIQKFCSTKYNVKFPLFDKVHAKGPQKDPLYAYLTSAATPPGEVGWNFEKFLIGKDGKVAGRFKSAVKPDDPELIGAIERELAK